MAHCYWVKLTPISSIEQSLTHNILLRVFRWCTSGVGQISECSATFCHGFQIMLKQSATVCKRHWGKFSLVWWVCQRCCPISSDLKITPPAAWNHGSGPRKSTWCNQSFFIRRLLQQRHGFIGYDAIQKGTKMKTSLDWKKMLGFLWFWTLLKTFGILWFLQSTIFFVSFRHFNKGLLHISLTMSDLCRVTERASILLFLVEWPTYFICSFPNHLPLLLSSLSSLQLCHFHCFSPILLFSLPLIASLCAKHLPFHLATFLFPSLTRRRLTGANVQYVCHHMLSCITLCVWMCLPLSSHAPVL